MVNLDLLFFFVLLIAVPLADPAITFSISLGIVAVCFQLRFEIAAIVVLADIVIVQHLIQLSLRVFIRLRFGNAVIIGMKITFRH